MNLYRSFDQPLEAPPVDPDGAACFTFDDKWRPYILTVLKALLVHENWANDADRAVGEASLLVEEFMTGGECESVVTMPSGSIIEFGGASAPTDWLLCDGAAVSRTTYAVLFAVIGEAFGDGDGTTTFNLPDFRGRAPIGAGQGTDLTNRALADVLGSENHALSAAELAAHTHTGPSHVHTGALHNHSMNHDHQIIPASGSGAVKRLNATSNTGTQSAVNVEAHIGSTGDSTAANTGASGTAATGSTGNGTSHNNMQPSLAVNFIIKT